jgi:UDP-2,3-diacylglucosamine pyrophosphatase LpxH
MLKILGYTSCISEVLLLVLFSWLITRYGFIGMLRWELGARSLFFKSTALLIIPVLSFLAGFVFYMLKKELPAVNCGVCLVFAVVPCIILAIVCGRIAYSGSRLPADHQIINNLLAAGESLPDRRNSDPAKPLLHVGFSSDPHWGADTASPEDRINILKQSELRGYDAFFILGDIAQHGDAFTAYEDVCTDINIFMPDVPVRLLMGNHDAVIDSSKRFRSYFYGRPSAPLSYRIDGGTVHFIILNLLWGIEDFSGREKDWLEDQLKTIPEDETVIILSHSFFISSGHYDSVKRTAWYDLSSAMNEFCPIFEKYHVDLVVSGHNHIMNLLKKNNVPYAVCGTMGGRLDTVVSYTSPFDIWHETATFGFIDAAIYPQKIDLGFYSSSGIRVSSWSIKTAASDHTIQELKK